MGFLKDALQWKKVVLAYAPIAMAVVACVGFFVGMMSPAEWMTAEGIFLGIGSVGTVADAKMNGAPSG